MGGGTAGASSSAAAFVRPPLAMSCLRGSTVTMQYVRICLRRHVQRCRISPSYYYANIINSLPLRLAHRSTMHYNYPLPSPNLGEGLKDKYMGWVSMAGKPCGRHPPQMASISSAVTPGSGGDGRTPNGGGGGGGSGGHGFESHGGQAKPVATGSDDATSAATNVIILDVGGMSCGGCAASVKRILESQPQVASASVNLATETAVVRAVPEAWKKKNWQNDLGENLASILWEDLFPS
uniref:HMA domain-containing protein n=1 Tax=Araucaria cunninghamii TaxID=56994 RepID=A0A0D6R920_ARACU